jgi:hypothetical protein
MRSEIVKSDQFQVIDRAHVQKMLQEQQFQLTGIVNEATMVQMGQIIGAQKIVTGRIGWLGKIRVITLQLIDVSTWRVESLETSDFVGDVEQLRRPVRAATQRLIGIGGFYDTGGGFIHVVSRPEGASVHVDGLFEGTTPLQVLVDSAGSYQVTVSFPGYQDWKRTVFVERNETSFLELALVSLRPSDIQMTSHPPGANVYVHSKFQGNTPIKVRVDSAGTYDVQMTLDGHHDWQETVHVRIGEDLGVEAALVPIEVIDLSSTPPGATAYIQGRFVGNTPLSVSVGQVGDYQIKLVRDGFQEWNRVVPVRAGERPAVRAALDPVEVPSPYVRTGRTGLWTFMFPYSMAAPEALIYSLGVKSERPYIGAVLVGAPLAYFGMMRYTAERDISAARTSMIVSSGLWGTAWGAMAAVSVRPGSGSLGQNNEWGLRAAAALSVAASASAIAASAYWTEKVDISTKRVGMINVGGFLGSVMGVGFPYLFDANDEKIYFASLMAGGLTGVGYSIYATSHMDSIPEAPPPPAVGSMTKPGWRFGRPYVTVAGDLTGRSLSYRRPDRKPEFRAGVVLAEYRFN